MTFRRWGGEEFWAKRPLEDVGQGDQGEEVPARIGGGVRKPITTFSAPSRRLFMRRLGALPVHGLLAKSDCVLVGLTYPAEFPGARASKRHLKMLRDRLRREYGDRFCGGWKLEPQKRGAPHYHFLGFLERLPVPSGEARYAFLRDGRAVSCGADLDAFTGWLHQAWWEIVGEGSVAHYLHGVDVQVVENPDRVGAYVAKYVGKALDSLGEVEWREPGRFWGLLNAKLIRRMLTGEIRVLTRAEYLFCRRLFRRFGLAAAKAAAAGRRADGKSGDWRRPAAPWLRAARGLATWNTFDRGKAGLSAALACLEKLGSRDVFRVSGVFL